MSKTMLSSEIVSSDAFLGLPPRAQTLYIQLCIEADCDGFVGRPLTVTRACGAKTADYEALVDMRFILTFSSGVCVIKHHWINNNKRSDRYKNTNYQEEYGLLDIKPNGAYTVREKVTNSPVENSEAPTLVKHLTNDEDSEIVPSTCDGTHLATTGIPVGSSTEHNITEQKKDSCPPPSGGEARARTDDGFSGFWEAYPRKVSKQEAAKAWRRLKPDGATIAAILAAIAAGRKSREWTEDGGRFIPYPATWLNQRRWEDGEGQQVRTVAIAIDDVKTFSKPDLSSQTLDPMRKGDMACVVGRADGWVKIDGDRWVPSGRVRIKERAWSG